MPAQSFRMALPSSLLTEWPAEAPWRRSTQKKICEKRFYAALWKVRNMAMQTPTRLLPALISRGLMLFSITDSATRSFSAGRVTARRPKDAWPRQRVNRMAAMRISQGVPHPRSLATARDLVASCWRQILNAHQPDYAARLDRSFLLLFAVGAKIGRS